MLLPVALMSLGALTACGQKTGSTADNNIAATNEADVNIAAAPLPPMIKDSKPYRCDDGTTVFVDFMTDGKSANLRLKRGEDPIALTAEQEGGPFSGNGYTVEADAPKTNITLPDKKPQNCES